MSDVELRRFSNYMSKFYLVRWLERVVFVVCCAVVCYTDGTSRAILASIVLAILAVPVVLLWRAAKATTAMLLSFAADVELKKAVDIWASMTEHVAVYERVFYMVCLITLSNSGTWLVVILLGIIFVSALAGYVAHRVLVRQFA